MARAKRDMNWYEFVCKFVDMKWPHVAATTRRTHAEAFTALAPAMFTTTRGKPADKLIRSTLNRWGFNTTRRNAEDRPDEVRAALRWVERNSRRAGANSTSTEPIRTRARSGPTPAATGTGTGGSSSSASAASQARRRVHLS